MFLLNPWETQIIPSKNSKLGLVVAGSNLEGGRNRTLYSRDYKYDKAKRDAQVLRGARCHHRGVGTT